MESVKENKCGTLSTPSTPQGVPDSSCQHLQPDISQQHHFCQLFAGQEAAETQEESVAGGSPPTSTSPGGSSAEAVSPAPSVSPLSTLSLDRKTFLRQKQSKQLQASDKTWVRSDLRRGCIHVHDWLTPSYPRPVLCTVDTTAAELASKLEGSKAGAVLRINFKTACFS
ncbi:hypothetical protein KUCAC02_023543 [Chaenocephalus aceratus]|uniref:Uncharacterized protein n=1 Tax=Chaenocephalus aceratus TaxID=36190 RepID=A0ACB9XQ86_CHAAC|nr:hypothetical protein KUCAC02_023543 [Chaenocephalus aceratus]